VRWRTPSNALDKIDVVNNGIHEEKFEFDFRQEEAQAFRAEFAAPEEKILFFVGRPVREKARTC